MHTLQLSGFPRVSLLEWDSRHFGFLVGRLRWAEGVRGLHEALLDARARGFRLLFVESQYSLLGLPILDEIAEDVFELSRQELGKELKAGGIPEPSPTVRLLSPDSYDLSRVRELGIIAGKFSRFFRDLRIPRDKAESLFAQWAEAGVRGSLAECAFGSFDETDRMAGLILLAYEKDAVRIALLSVLPSDQRRGHGSALLREAERWAARRKRHRIVVATQSDNFVALRLYSRSGYSTTKTSVISHVWLRQ